MADTDETRRLTILQLLAGAPDAQLAEGRIAEGLRGRGIEPDAVAGDLDWLAAHGLISLADFEQAGGRTVRVALLGVDGALVLRGRMSLADAGRSRADPEHEG